MTREELNKLIMQACERVWNEKTCKEIEQALSQEQCDKCRNNHTSICGNCKEYDEFEPCDDVVNRKAVINAIDKWITEYKPQHYLIQSIRELPPVMRKSGKWIAQDVHNCHTDFRCSECDYIHSFMHLYGEPSADYTYCPKCGARMESEE